MELLPELREIKVLVPIPPLERELHTSLRRISISVSREAVHLIQVAQRSLIVIKQRGWRRGLAGLSDLRKGLVGAEFDEENAEGEDGSVGNEMLEVIHGRLPQACWRGENVRDTRGPRGHLPAALVFLEENAHLRLVPVVAKPGTAA